jgi:hypothetical protein
MPWSLASVFGAAVARFLPHRAAAPPCPRARVQRVRFRDWKHCVQRRRHDVCARPSPQYRQVLNLRIFYFCPKLRFPT